MAGYNEITLGFFYDKKASFKLKYNTIRYTGSLGYGSGSAWISIDSSAGFQEGKNDPQK
jgi:hypothetical protein